jgi:DNA-binding PadR family transcriptional regulator
VIEDSMYGRFAEPARLILQALRRGPRPIPILLDDVRSADGPLGPGSLYAAIARLERARLIAPAPTGDGRAAYRLGHTEEAR